MVMMSYHHALRVSELVNLKWSQVDLSQVRILAKSEHPFWF